MAAPKRRGRPRKEESAAKNTSENKKTAAKSATAKKTTAKKPSASAKKTLKPQGDTVFDRYRERSASEACNDRRTGRGY